MPKLQKLNQITYLTDNIPATLHFYTEVLGMRLVQAERRAVRPSDLICPDGMVLEGDFSEQLTIMLEMQNGSRLAFTEIVGLDKVAANPLPRWIKHLAMQAGSLEELRVAKANLEKEGIGVLGITDHGLFRSIYFFDPINQIRLEYACNMAELDEEDSRVAWQALEIWQGGGVPPNRSIH